MRLLDRWSFLAPVHLLCKATIGGQLEEGCCVRTTGRQAYDCWRHKDATGLTPVPCPWFSAWDTPGTRLTASVRLGSD